MPREPLTCVNSSYQLPKQPGSARATSYGKVPVALSAGGPE